MEIEFLKEIVHEAEQISRQKVQIHQKDAFGDLVTNLDLEIEKYLISEIRRRYPNYDIISEELNTDNEVTDNCFIIDPIDGTVNFANGIPLWGIQIACRKNGITIASVISLPVLNEFYYADETGAYLNDTKISVREVPLKNAVYTIIGKNSPQDVGKMRNHSRHHRNFGAACLAFAYVASGRIHGVNFRVEHPWDYEPGLFICQMAGAATKSTKGFHAAAMNQEFLDALEQESALKQT